MILLCLASSTGPRRRNLLVALAQYTVTHFRSSSTKSSSWFLSSLMPMLADAHISSLGYLWYIRNLKGFSKLKACLHVRRLKAQKATYEQRVNQLVPSKTLFCGWFFHRAKTVIKLMAVSFNSTNFFSVGDILSHLGFVLPVR